jgi:type IV secretory pathway VirB2 component (pilin)
MKSKSLKIVAVALVAAMALSMPLLGYCSVDSTLNAIQGKLTTTILPAVGILGLMFAGLSFFTGNPNARSHLVMGIIGAVVGFGAPSIIDLIRTLVR